MKTIKSKSNTNPFNLLHGGLRKCVFLFLIVVFAGSLKGQDMHFTQFFSAPLYLNPAFTGSSHCSRFAITYRNQWPGISRTYRSFLFSADHYIHSKNLGVGILFGSDIAGAGKLKTTLINPSISYEARLSRKFGLRFGLLPGLTMKSINYNNLLFGDQLARGGGSVGTLELPAQSRVFIDLGAGILAYTEKYWGGISAYHLNQPNESLMGDNAKLPVKYSVHGGAKFMINKEKEKEKPQSQRKSTTMAFNYRAQNKYDQLDIGVYYSQNIVNFGIWYRGIPVLKAYKEGYSNNDAVALIIGLQTSKINIGYSYDITISRLYKISNGAHELTLYYQICKAPKKKKYGLLLPCPKF